MVGVKKFLRDELVHLTILLSLLRIDPYHLDLDGFGVETVHELVLGSSSASFTYRNVRNGFPHGRLPPKNLQETMLLNQRDIFFELNSLGRYDRYNGLTAMSPHAEVTTYLLCGQEPMSTVEPQVQNATVNPSMNSPPDVSPAVEQNGSVVTEAEAPIMVVDLIQPPDTAQTDDVTSQEDSNVQPGSESVANVGDMTKEDMDLIEILLRQDIDLGVTRDVFDVQLRKEVLADHEPNDPLTVEVKNKDEKEAVADVNVDDVLDPWSGLNYTIDSETGEHVVLDDIEEAGPSSETGSVFVGTPLSTSDLLNLADELDTIPLDDLSLVGTNEENQKKLEDKDSGGEEVDLDLLADDEESFAEELKELEDMIQSAQLHHGGARLQPRVQYLRSVSMEQRWQDLTNFLSYPPPTTTSEAELHHHHHHHHHHHNMGMGMLHNGSTSVGGPTAVHGHVVAQHNYTLPNYGIDNRTSSVLIQNATLPQPVADINSNMSYPGEVGGDPTNVGAAVVTSMSTLANGSDSMADTAPHAHYQMDAGTMMFPGNHTEVNQTTEGFLSSILNDEDLQLMDMAMNEGTGMYTMRMLENDDAMDTSSDSAVSSMASSERVPSISDGEWMETTSGSPHPVEEQEQRYYGMEAKYRPYNYSYAPGMAPSSHHRPNNHPGSGGGGSGASANDGTNAPGMDRRMPPVAQKKYQLFGKRVGMDQPPMGGVTYGALPRGSASMPQPTAPMKYPGYLYPGVQDHNSSSSYGSLEGATAPNTSVGPVESKYSCSLEFARQHTVGGSPASLNHIQHNHTYQLPSNGVADLQRPTVRDKHKKAAAAAAALAAGEDHLPRDEKRARAMKIPLTTDEIINLPMDEFNERLSKYDLTEPQLALIRDIRRRGKNKVAAQNCRKRKLDQILTLAEEVQRMHHEREHLMQQQQSFNTERQRMKDKFSQLYRHVFQSLRDPDGNPYSPYEYSLQQAADGNILLVPRNGTVNMELQEACKGPKSKGGRREDGKK